MRSKFKRFLAVIGLAGLLAVPAAVIGLGRGSGDHSVRPEHRGRRERPRQPQRRSPGSHPEAQGPQVQPLRHHVNSFENPTDPKQWGKAVAANKGWARPTSFWPFPLRDSTTLPQTRRAPSTRSVQHHTERCDGQPGRRQEGLCPGGHRYRSAIGDAAGGGGNVPAAERRRAVLVGVGVVAAGGAGAYLYFRNRRKKALAGQSSSASYGPQGGQVDPLGVPQRGRAAP
jgi:hypothetical protein